MRPSLVLASTSPIRRQMLVAARLDFIIDAPRVDEETLRVALEAEGAKPRDLADALAEAKARKVASRHPDAFVIGSDQVLDLDGTVYAKPHSEEELRAQLAQLSGKTHRLSSAVVVYERGEPVWRHVGIARLTMHELSRDFAAHYVTRNWGEIRHCVGGYQIEGEGVRLFSRVEGSTHTILGLPLVELLAYLTLRKVIEI